MSTEPPIACSLNAADLRGRLAEMSDLGREHLLDVMTESRHAALTFGAADGVRQRLDAVVAAESTCCAFLQMSVSKTEDDLTLTIDAPEGAEPVLEELVDAFRGQAQVA
jgi:hypothetical protein